MRESRRTRITRRLRERDPRLVFWFSWVILTAMAGVWALANPMSASPDEPSHIIKAAALVRNHTLGDETLPGVRAVQLPRIYAMTPEIPGCYAFKPAVPASCWRVDFTNVDVDETALTTAGNYNPLYYAVAGLPSLLPARLEVLYLMRLVSAALCAAMLAMGLRSLAEAPVRRWAVTGTAVAITPMVVFLNSTVNPNALEVSAGLGLWLTLLVALRYPDPGLVARRWTRAGVLVVLFVNAKAFSPFYLAIIVLTVMALVPWRNVVGAVRDWRTWPGIGLGVVGSVLAVVWILTAGGVAGLDKVNYPELDHLTALDRVLRLTTTYYQGMIGQFGWFDTRPPDGVYAWFTAAFGLVLLLALTSGRRREVAVLVALALSVVLLPVAMQVPQASHVGLPWQGRYILAVAVGVPVLAGLICDRGLTRVPLLLVRRLTVLVALAMGVIQFVSFGANLRRYVAGVAVPWFEAVPVPWNPPLPVAVLVPAAFVAVAALTWLVLWLASGPVRLVPGNPDHELVAPAGEAAGAAASAEASGVQLSSASNPSR